MSDEFPFPRYQEISDVIDDLVDEEHRTSGLSRGIEQRSPSPVDALIGRSSDRRANNSRAAFQVTSPDARSSNARCYEATRLKDNGSISLRPVFIRAANPASQQQRYKQR